MRTESVIVAEFQRGTARAAVGASIAENHDLRIVAADTHDLAAVGADGSHCEAVRWIVNDEGVEKGRVTIGVNRSVGCSPIAMRRTASADVYADRLYIYP